MPGIFWKCSNNFCSGRYLPRESTDRDKGRKNERTKYTYLNFPVQKLVYSRP